MNVFILSVNINSVILLKNTLEELLNRYELTEYAMSYRRAFSYVTNNTYVQRV